MFVFIIIMQTPSCTYLIHLCIRLQSPKCHLVGTWWKRPKRSWQVIQSVRQSAVYIDVEARWTALQAAGVEHHMVISTIRQGGMVEAGGAESAVSLLEAKSHYKRTERVKHSEESRQRGVYIFRLLRNPLGRHRTHTFMCYYYYSPLFNLACTMRSRYLVLSLGLMMLKRELGALLWSLKDERRKASSRPLFFKLP